jgi:NAD(P)-dependent dehydrogenase (short-subunit alcohol dehydrogenase family)
MRLANKVAIVTGGGTGIGAAITQLFAQEGAGVTITGRRQEILARMVDAISSSGGHALAVPGSVTEEADVQHAVQTTLECFGRVDILVNNAGSTPNDGPLHEMTDKMWDETMDVFLRGVFRFSRAVIPAMIRQGGGAIVETSLTASWTSDATMRAALEARHPLGRLGTPEDIARAAVYFASDESCWTTGSVLTVDGGVMAR